MPKLDTVAIVPEPQNAQEKSYTQLVHNVMWIMWITLWRTRNDTLSRCGQRWGKAKQERDRQGGFLIHEARKKWFDIAGADRLGVGLLVSACGYGWPASRRTGGSGSGSGGCGAAEKVYVVGTDAAYPPFQMLEADKISGHDIDVMNAIAEAGGFKIEWKNTGWDPLFDGLDRGTVDIGISSITITREAQEKVRLFGTVF